jgi:hypothetical protein
MDPLGQFRIKFKSTYRRFEKNMKCCTKVCLIAQFIDRYVTANVTTCVAIDGITSGDV